MKPNHKNPFAHEVSAPVSLLAAGLLIALGTTASFATSASWNVATSGDWSTAGNWSAGAPGLAGNNSTADTAGFGGSTNYTVYLSGSRSISTVTFSNTGATALLGGSSTTAANEFLYLYGGVTINAGAGAVTIGDTAGSPTRKVDIRMGTSTIANNSSSLLTIANALGSRGTGSTTTITLGGTGNTTVSGAIGGGLGATVALTKSGSGTVTLSGNNTFGGLLSISAGTLTISGAPVSGGNVALSGATAGTQLNLNSTTALGAAASALTISSGDNARIDNTSGSAITIANANPQAWNSNFTFVGSNDLNMGTGNITLGGNRTVTATAKILTLDGVIADGANTFGLTKAGSGTMVLTKANTYDGVSSVTLGVLRITNGNALGSTTGATTVTAGSLELSSGITTHSGESLTFSGVGNNNIGALRAGTGSGTWAGPVAIGAAGARLGATLGNTLTVTGAIADGAANSLAISGESGTGVIVINPTTTNTYTGRTEVIRGILQLGKTDALPVITVLDVDAASSVTDAAVFDLASYNQTVAALQDSAAISINGKITNSISTTTSKLTLSQASNTTFDGVIENGNGAVELTKEGSGTLTLNGANTYTGTTSLNTGGLVVNGAFASNVNAGTGTSLTFGALSSTSATTVNAASGSALSFAGVSSTAALNMASGSILTGEGTLSGTASVTFAAGTSALQFNVDTPGSLTVPSVTTSGATVFVVPQGTITTGNTYVALTNSSGFTGTASDNYIPASRGTLAFGGPLAGGLPTELQFTAAAPVTTLTWKGNASPANQWDINTTANWDNGSGPDVFFNFDSLAFDDGATTTAITVLPASVSVGAMNFNNPTKDYSISGGGIAGPAALVKDGGASLTLSNANSFTGGTTLNSGTLNINNATALGTAAVGLVINGGAIDNTSGSAVTTVSYPLTLNTDVAFTGSNDLNLGASATHLGTTVASSRTITTSAGTLRIGGAISNGSGGANEIVKAGNGTLTLAGASGYTGLTTISAGTLKLGASGTSTTSCPLGTTAAGTTVTSGATLDFGGFRAFAEAITIAGTGVGANGALVNSGADQINALESLTLAANASVGGNGNRFDLRQNTATPALNLADFTLTKSGSNTFSLVGTNVTPGSGHIDITGGTFSIQTTTLMNGSAANTITVRNGATLNCFQSGTWTAPVWSVLMDAGSNFINSNGFAFWDGTVTLNGGASAGGAANLTINGTVSGASGSLTKTGAGVLTLAGTAANTYGGLTTVNGGFLYLSKPVGTNAVPGNISIGAGGVTIIAADQIPDAATVTLTTATSKFNINGKAETVSNVDMQNAANTVNDGLVTGVNGKLTITGTLTHTLGNITLSSSGAGNSRTIEANAVTNNGGSWTFGSVDGTQKLIVGSGGLTIGGGSTIAVNALVGTADNFISLGGNLTSTAASATNTISGLGKIHLNASRTFTVADDTPVSDLTVSAVIADGSGTGALVKEGAGTLTLNAVNSYTGATTVNGGSLVINEGSIASSSNVVNNAALTYNLSATPRTYANVISGSGSLTKSGASTLTLSGVNTYTGNTVVNAGTLALAATTGQLKFVIAATSGVNNGISGTGTVTLAGNFDIDTSAVDASALTTGTWTLVDAATLNETFSSSFTILGAGWSENSNVWTKTVGTRKYTFTEADGKLVLSPAASYVSWIAGFFPGETDPAIIGATADPDNDGIDNGVEMVLGGNPKLDMDSALLPTIELVNADPDGDTTFSDYLLFTYRRSDFSVTAGVTSACETDADLVGPWTPAASVLGTVILTDDNYNASFTPPATADTDRVRVYVPRSSNTTLFGRLNAHVP